MTVQAFGYPLTVKLAPSKLWSAPTTRRSAVVWIAAYTATAVLITVVWPLIRRRPIDWWDVIFKTVMSTLEGWLIVWIARRRQRRRRVPRTG